MAQARRIRPAKAWPRLLAGWGLTLGLGIAQGAPFAYLATNSTTVKVLDLATNTTTDVVLPNLVKNGIAVNRQGTRVYLTGTFSRGKPTPGLQVIDATTQTALAPIPLSTPPGYTGATPNWLGVAVNPAGDRAYLTLDASPYVTVVDTVNRQIAATILVGETPANLVFNAAGTRLYAATPTGIAVIDPQTNTVTANVALGQGAFDLSLNPQGTRLYAIRNAISNPLISVVDTTSNTLLTTIPVDFLPASLVVSGDGSKLYVSDYTIDNAQVAVFDTGTNTLLRRIPVGSRSSGISVTPNGRTVVVANYLSNTASVIDTASDTVTATIAASSAGPAFGQFITPDKNAIGPSPTGTGTVSLGLEGGGDNCRITNPSFTTPPGTPPAGMNFVHGVVSFTAMPCTSGASVTVRITYPSPIPAGAVLYKYGRTAVSPSQAVYTPVQATLSGNTVSYTVTDGGAGDDDLSTNGQIVDPVGLGVPVAGAGAGGAASVPTLNEWALAMLTGLMALAALCRRRRSR